MPAVKGEIFQMTNFEEIWQRVCLNFSQNLCMYINIKLRELQTQRRQQRTKRHCANTAYILIQSHNAEVGIFYRKFGI